MKTTTHNIFRSYISLARGEHYSQSDLGDVIEFFVPESGEMIDSLPSVQLNWVENEDFKKQICEARNLTDEQFFDLMIIPKPTPVQNMIYSAQLRRVYGLDTLRFMQGFDREGNFILPGYRGFFAPLVEDKKIIKLKFYEFSKLMKKAA